MSFTITTRRSRLSAEAEPKRANSNTKATSRVDSIFFIDYETSINKEQRRNQANPDFVVYRIICNKKSQAFALRLSFLQKKTLKERVFGFTYVLGRMKHIPRSAPVAVKSIAIMRGATLSRFPPLRPRVKPIIRDTTVTPPRGANAFHFHPRNQTIIVKKSSRISMIFSSKNKK